MALLLAAVLTAGALLAGVSLGNASIPVDQRQGTPEQERRRGDWLFVGVVACAALAGALAGALVLGGGA